MFVTRTFNWQTHFSDAWFLTSLLSSSLLLFFREISRSFSARIMAQRPHFSPLLATILAPTGLTFRPDLFRRRFFNTFFVKLAHRPHFFFREIAAHCLQRSQIKIFGSSALLKRPFLASSKLKFTVRAACTWSSLTFFGSVAFKIS